NAPAPFLSVFVLYLPMRNPTAPGLTSAEFFSREARRRASLRYPRLFGPRAPKISSCCRRHPSPSRCVGLLRSPPPATNPFWHVVVPQGPPRTSLGLIAHASSTYLNDISLKTRHEIQESHCCVPVKRSESRFGTPYGRIHQHDAFDGGGMLAEAYSQTM